MSSEVDSQRHVLVVGCGVVGLSLAFQLARRKSCSVTVVDRAPCVAAPGAASANGWGWVNAFRKDPAEYAQLNANSLACWRQLLADIGAPSDASRSGTVMWADCEADAVKLREHMQGAQSRGYSCWPIGPDRLKELCPELALSDFSFGCYCPDELLLDSTLVLPHLLSAVQAQGAEVLFDIDVVDVFSGGVALRDGGSLTADVVILAAGVGTVALASSLDVNLDVQATNNTPVDVHKSCALTSGVGNLVWFTSGLSFHCMSHNSGRVVLDVHGSGAGPGDAVANRFDGSELCHAWSAVLPELSNTQAQLRTTVKPVPSDGMSVVGWLAPKTYVCVTHSGWTLAALLGQLGALEVADDVEVATLKPFRPRPSVSTPKL